MNYFFPLKTETSHKLLEKGLTQQLNTPLK